MALLLQVTDAEAAKIRIQVETPGGVVQKVFLARPAGLAADRPVVFAMHGEQRNAYWFAQQIGTGALDVGRRDAGGPR